VFPLLIRDVYHGDVADLGVLTMTFPVGAVVSSLWLIRRGRLRRKGRAVVLSQAGAALALGVISTGVPFPAAVAASLAWGVCGGLFLNSGRTIFQQTAPESHRARILSVYTLGFMGGGALGSPLAGFLAGWLGPLETCATNAAGMLICLLAASLFTRILHVR
jgi:MFS family permease